MYSQKITDLIKKRSSCRNYDPRPIKEEEKKALTDAFSRCIPSPFGHGVMLHLLEKEDRKEKFKLGTYGMIRNPQYFVLGAIRKSERAYESYGYILEQIILKATDLGLGTCWLGYFHERSDFKNLSLTDDEILPAVSPVGYGSPSRRMYDRIVQATARPRTRGPWERLFFLDNAAQPLRQSDAGPYAAPLEMVRIAPSAGNRQPWRIIKERERNWFHFYLDHRACKRGYEQRGLPHIDMGIAMCHFELTCAENNLRGKWGRNPNPKFGVPPELEHIITWCGEDSSPG